jgi:hypothetical protein
VDDIDRRLGAVLSDEEIKTLTDLLGRLGDSDTDCTP